MERKVFVGFDGYVDRIVRIIRKCELGKNPEFYPTIESFAERTHQAAGLSCEFEIYRQEERLGGNAPILAKALAALGADVTMVAAVDHPIFDTLRKNAKVYSVGIPAECMNIEFDDGKLMMPDSTPMSEMNYQTLVQKIGEEKLKEMVGSASVAALVNYCGILQAYDLWKGFLEHIAVPGKMWFFDIADPTKYPAEHLIRCLELLREYRAFGEVVLGVNRNEASFLMNALQTSDEAEIVKRGYVDTLLVHPREGVSVIDASGETFVKGRLVEHPLVSTGGGDHFNAGYCYGRMLGMNKTEAAALGTRVSGAFVASGQSPDWDTVNI